MRYFLIVAMLVCLLLEGVYAQKPKETGWELAYSSYEYNPRDLGGICGEPKVLPRPYCDDPCARDNTVSDPCVFAIEEKLREGDSLKYIIVWRQPSDTFGIADSVWYLFSSNTAVRFYVGPTPTAVGAKVKRSWKSPVLTDSFKMARPRPGVLANFVIDSFVQCRKGACSRSGARSWKYLRSVTETPAVAPPMQVPTVDWDSF